MSLRLSRTLVLALFAASATTFAVDPNPGNTVDFMSYFETTTRGCVASSPTPTSWDRITRESPSGCGQDMWHYTKGQNCPFGIETFYVQNRYVKLIEEIGPDPNCSGGLPYFYRAYRSLFDHRKGFKWAPLWFSPGFAFTIPDWVEEYWVDQNGHPACYGVNHTTQGPVTASVEFFAYTVTGWLTDARSSPDFTTTDVYVVQRTSYAGYGDDDFFYGKIWNDRYQRWEGLGFIGFG